MKKAFFIIGVLFFVNSVIFAQHSGNRIYGNKGYVNKLRAVAANTGNLANRSSVYNYSIESNVLLNVKPDSYVVVFGFDRLGSTSKNSNEQVNATLDRFLKDLAPLGITKNDIYIDFITQTRTVVNKTATAVQTKKTVAVRYRDRNLFEKIVTIAASRDIFDLIKVDYIVSDFDRVREQLFDKAAATIKSKYKKYTDLLGAKLVPKNLALEKYDAFYPSERYVGYQTSFYYQALNPSKFDKVITPVGIEPVVQFTLHLRMDYDIGSSKDK